MCEAKRFFVCLKFWFDDSHSEYLYSYVSSDPRAVSATNSVVLCRGELGSAESDLIASIPHGEEVTCLDAIKSKEAHVVVAIGSVDGSVALYLCDVTTSNVKRMFTLSLTGPALCITLGVEMILTSTSKDCALHYYAETEESLRNYMDSGWNVVRVDVPLRLIQPSTPWNSEKEFFCVPTCAQIHYSNAQMSLCKEDYGLLCLGCNDGTVWCAELPSHQSVLDLNAVKPCIGDLTVQTTLLESFPSGILHLSVWRKGSVDVLQVVEASGRAALLPGFRNNQCGVSTRHQHRDAGKCGKMLNRSYSSSLISFSDMLPIDADLSSILFISGVIVYLSRSTAALYASYVGADYNDELGQVWKCDEQAPRSNGNKLITRKITTPRCPHILAFGLINPSKVFTFSDKKMKQDDAEDVTNGALILHTLDGGVIACELCGRSLQKAASSHSELVEILQQSCSINFGGQIRSIVDVMECNAHRTTDNCFSFHHSQSAADGVVSLGKDFILAKTKHATLQLALKESDEALLRAIAFLSALRDDRNGLKFKFPADRVKDAKSGGDEGTGESFAWSPKATNEVIGAELRYRLRSEPSHTYATATAVYLDIEVLARTLCALRVLDGRVLLLSVCSTALNIAMHPNTFTFSSTLQFSEQKNCSSNVSRCTASLPQLSNLCSHRLVISLVCEGPSNTEDVHNLLDVLLPMSLLAKVVSSVGSLRSKDDRMTYCLSVPMGATNEGLSSCWDDMVNISKTSRITSDSGYGSGIGAKRTEYGDSGFVCSSSDRSFLANCSAELHTAELRKVGECEDEVEMNLIEAAADVKYLPLELQQILNTSAHICTCSIRAEQVTAERDLSLLEEWEEQDFAEGVWSLYSKLRSVPTNI